MTKADRIREMYDLGVRDMRVIADAVGCSTAYARVYARQRRDGPSIAQRNYYERAYAKRIADPAHRDKELQRQREKARRYRASRKIQQGQISP